VQIILRYTTSTVVPGGEGRAVAVRAGQRVQVVNTHGGQVADTWAIAQDDPTVHLSVAHSRVAIGAVSPRVGDELVDQLRQPILRIVGDSSGGRHDTLLPACDPARYRSLGVVGAHRNCQSNFIEATTALGVAPPFVPDPLNLFQDVQVTPSGSLDLRSSPALAGSAVEFEALRDLILVVSACPMTVIPISGEGSGPRDVEIRIAYTGAD
jgi:uncharacterized protein YcgI (DUF1989 family)